MKYLPEAIASLERQTFKDFTVTVIDNGSVDGTVDYVRNNFPYFGMLRNVKNLGFARAHNQGIEMVRNAFYKRGESDSLNCFILLMNQDIILEPNCLENLVKSLAEKENAGVIGPKLLRAFWDLETLGRTSEVIFSKIIDSTGLVLKKTKQCVDRGSGELEGDKHDVGGYVFGISGALPMFRLKALEDAKISRVSNSYIRKEFVISRETSEASGQYFDEDYFCYKEDVDLCWRLKNIGWKAYYEPQAMAHHFRGAKGTETFSLFRIFKERRKKSMLVNFWSTRNHLLTLVKNLSFKEFLRDSWAIIPYEAAKFIYILFFETDNLKAYGEFIKLLPKAISKRRVTKRAS
jgi:GT2 family glycosyltransferase